MQDASHAEMRRQIRREGRRWGLVPMERDGEIVVGQVARKFLQHGSLPGFTLDEVRYVAHLTMSHGFTGCLYNLRKLEERDANMRADARQAKIHHEAQQQYDAVVDTYTADALRLIRKGGWDEFVRALIGPDPRTNNRQQRRARAARAR